MVLKSWFRNRKIKIFLKKNGLWNTYKNFWKKRKYYFFLSHLISCFCKNIETEKLINAEILFFKKKESLSLIFKKIDLTKIDKKEVMEWDILEKFIFSMIDNQKISFESIKIFNKWMENFKKNQSNYNIFIIDILKKVN